MSVENIRVVIDTQVFLRAAINLKSLPAKLIFDLRDQYQLVASEEIIAEVRDVLFRAKVRAKFPHLSDELAEQVIEPLVSADMLDLMRLSRFRTILKMIYF